ncbi:hypothetical protein [Agromyces bauzanensis]
MEANRLGERVHPATAAASVMLGGGLRQGAVYQALGSLSVVMELVAGVSRAGGWVAVVDVPQFGIEAAAAHGIELERLALVRDTRGQALRVIAALADTVPVVVAGPAATLSPDDAARFAGRLRKSGTTLITLGDWPDVDGLVTASPAGWDGLENGHGLLRASHLAVELSGRLSPRPRRSILTVGGGPARAEFTAAPRRLPRRQSA